MNFRTLISLVAGVVGARFLGAFLGLGTQIILTRLFLPAEVGLILFGMSAASLISLLVSGGYPAFAFTKLPQLLATNRISAVKAVHGAFMRSTLLAWIVFSCVAALVIAFVPLQNGLPVALVMGCIAALPSSLIRYNSAIANTLRRFSLSYMPDFIVRPSLLLAYLGVAKLWGVNLTVTHVLAAFVAMIFAIAVYLAFALGNDAVALSNWSDTRPRLSAALRRPAFAMLIVATITTAFADLVTMIGGFLLPSVDVALLGVTIRLASIAAFVIQATQQFVLPDLTKAMAARDGAQADALMLKMNVISIATLLAGLAAAFVLGKMVLGIFGTEYVQGYGLLMLLLLAQAVRALGGMNQHLLSLAGKQMQTAGACLTAVIILVAVSTSLAKGYGATGVGYAVLTCELVWAIYLATLCRRLTGSRGDLLWLLAKQN
jgi:O-antigen/teichoic acid export membrane protein